MKKYQLVIALPFLLNACASIVNGSSQDIELYTTPSVNASCSLDNERGEWTLAQTPGTVTVKRSSSPLNIQCENDEYHGSLINKAEAESWTAGNILLGGGIGAGIDAGTGAMFSYDNEIIVPLAKR